MLLLNIGVVIWLGLCALASFTNPSEIPFIALFSLTTPFAIIANLFFVFFWLLFTKKKSRFLFSLLIMLICYSVILTVFGFNFGKKSVLSKADGRLKLVSWNVHGLGIFDRPVNKMSKQEFSEYFKELDADIICMPEFPIPNKGNKKTSYISPRTIMKENGYKDYRFQADNTLGTETYLGTAVFSKYPLKNYKAHRISEFIYLLSADVELSETITVRMFFVHLVTFGLSDYDRAYIEEVRKSNTDVRSDLRRSKTFIGKFNYAFALRAHEADSSQKIIEKSPYPVVICGDFNDLPGSYTYTTFRGDRKDAFLEQGVGIGRTYNQILPTLRIDYVFYDPKALKIIGYKCPYTRLSDHNPVITNFEIL